MSRTMLDLRRVLPLLALTLPIACQQLGWNTRAITLCPGALVPSTQIEGDFLLRQHLRVTAGEDSFSMELALQKRGDELVLVGFHPLGAKLFTARQVGTEVAIEAHPAPALEVPPENVLRDIHRVNFLSLSPPAADGVIRGQRQGIEIREDWEAGGLRERSFRGADGAPEVARIVFSNDASTGEESASLHHAGCGYHAEFRTLSKQDLP